MNIKNSFKNWPDSSGYFGKFGGRYVAETLMPLILEVEKDSVKEFLFSLHAKKFSDKSIARKVATLKSFDSFDDYKKAIHTMFDGKLDPQLNR